MGSRQRNGPNLHGLTQYLERMKVAYTSYDDIQLFALEKFMTPHFSFSSMVGLELDRIRLLFGFFKSSAV
jgi:hypothetical protein